MQEAALRDAFSTQEFFKWIVLTAIDLTAIGVMDLWQKFVSSIEVAAPLCHAQHVHCANVKADFKLLSWQQMGGFCARAESRSVFQKMVSLS